MDYTRYSRAVIVLEEKSREFAARLGEEIKGYLRVETGNGRGAFRCVMQNVKHFPRSEYTYQLILFGKRNERTIHTILGTVPVSRYGTGEVYLRFRPQDVDGEGNDYSRYTTAIIAAVSSTDKREQLHPVLMGKTGYEEEKIQVSAMMSERPQREESQPESENGAEAQTPSEITQETAHTQEDARGTVQETQQGFVRENAQEITQEAAHTQETAHTQEDARETVQETPQGGTRKTYNHFYGQYLKNVCAYFCSVPGYYRSVRPFSEAMRDVQWLKIDNPRSMFLVSPGAQYFTGKYGHFLLGYGEEGNGGQTTYYVAVPGRFRAEDQPDGGESGFRYWLPLGEREEEAAKKTASGDRERYGYWIAAIDGASGDIFSLERG